MRVAMVRDLLSAGWSAASVVDWCNRLTPADIGRGVAPKTWRCTEPTARKYIALARDQNLADDLDDRDRKRADNRQGFRRVFRLAMSTGDLRTALMAQTMLCRIDGSFEVTTVPGAPVGSELTDDEAVKLIDHAASTLALARSQGALGPSSAVIDATSTEVIDEDDEGAEEQTSPTVAAN